MLKYRSYIVNLTVKDIFKLLALNNLFKIIIKGVKYFELLYILIRLLNSAVERLRQKRKALQLPKNT